jgi:hypothetical protein
VHAALTNGVISLSSEEAHIVETCRCILEVDNRNKVEQIRSEAIKERRGTMRRPPRQLDASWRSLGPTWRSIEGNPLGPS